MKNKLLIIGASGHGKVVADIARKMNKWERIAFLDDNEYIQESLGIEVLGKSVDAFKYIKEFDLFVAIGNNDIRARIQNSLLAEGASIPLLVHPNSTIGEQVAVGKGTAIMAGVVINSSTKIGNGCIVNTAATIDHDNWIDDYVHISPGVHLAGTVKIGQKSWLGIGAAVSNNVSITSNCKIGAGAVVVKDITEPGTYVGVPVRRVFKNENSSVS
jgi:sugar O-acyltransferase (sialic acid O-acetyltransferase NeuD family)